jgi:hypothetical protein
MPERDPWIVPLRRHRPDLVASAVSAAGRGDVTPASDLATIIDEEGSEELAYVALAGRIGWLLASDATTRVYADGHGGAVVVWATSSGPPIATWLLP